MRVNVPEKIVDTYTRNYDIVHLDKIVKEKLRQEHERLPALREEKEDLILSMDRPMFYRQYQEKAAEFHQLDHLIREIETNARFNAYVRQSEAILADYKVAAKKMGPVTFGQEAETEDDIQRVYLIEAYLRVAREYMHIEVMRASTTSPNCCLTCRTVLVEDINEDGVVVCTNCQSVHQNPFSSANSMETERPGVSTSDDDSLENFMNALSCYQGLQSTPLDDVIKVLDTYFKGRDLPLGAEIRALPLDKFGRRGDTDHQMLNNALAKSGLSDYYGDVNLIGHVYWGWTLPDISHLVEAIIAIYIETQRVFHSIPVESRERSSSLSIPFRLWKTLEYLGYKRPISEFKIAGNPESLRVHNELWEQMLEGAGLSVPASSNSVIYKKKT